MKNENDANTTPRRRGRPPAFDRETVLEAARRAFWERGYEGTSITDLTAAMGITPQSLYAAFRSKEELYREVLAQYRRAPEMGHFAALRADMDAVTALEQVLKGTAIAFAAPEHPKGCMISTAVLNCAEENDTVAHYVTDLRRQSLANFAARIRRGIDEGHLRPDTDVDGLARFLGAIVQGMSVQARDGATAGELSAIAEQAGMIIRSWRA